MWSESDCFYTVSKLQLRDCSSILSVFIVYGLINISILGFIFILETNFIILTITTTKNASMNEKAALLKIKLKKFLCVQTLNVHTTYKSLYVQGESSVTDK